MREKPQKTDVNTSLKPPIADRKPYEYETPYGTIKDEYHWLRDENWPNVNSPDIISYLNQENDYFKANTSHLRDLKQSIYNEIKAKISEDDQTVPVRKDNYEYYSFIKAGYQYWVHARKPYGSDKQDHSEIILDQNELAEGKEYFNLGAKSISPDHKILAYATDTNGSERYTLYFKNLSDSSLLEDTIENTLGGVVWHQSGLGVFYTPVDEQWRTNKVYFHKLGTDSSQDILIYEEKDDTFTVRISKTSSERFIIIYSQSKQESEIWYADANIMLDALESHSFKLFKARQEDQLYSISDHDDTFYVITNDMGRNFRLASVPIGQESDPNKWRELIAHSPEKYLRGLSIYRDFMVLESTVAGLDKLEIIDENGTILDEIKFEDESYEASSIYTQYDYTTLRYQYSSLKSPAKVFEYDLKTKKYSLLKEQLIPSGFDSSLYEVKRLFTESTMDKGVQIPFTLIYRKDKFKHDGSAPLYLYGYGSYGIAIPTSFRTSIFSLIDRGYVYVISHIRGGDDLGFEWYEQAKHLHKKRTFQDYLDIADYLVKEQYTSAGKLITAGGSAGGMLVGYAINARPELFSMAILHVPFVDVLNTMLDHTLPLTPGEYKEWGNPSADPEIFSYIKSYSPYDNIIAQNYPNIFITAGISDPRVTYWEPAKYAAKLRYLKTDDNKLFLKTNMDAGHSGKSGRYEYLEEVAEEYAIILDTKGSR